MITEVTTLETDSEGNITTKYWVFSDPVDPEKIVEAFDHIGGRPDDRN